MSATRSCEPTSTASSRVGWLEYVSETPPYVGYPTDGGRTAGHRGPADWGLGRVSAMFCGSPDPRRVFARSTSYRRSRLHLRPQSRTRGWGHRLGQEVRGYQLPSDLPDVVHAEVDITRRGAVVDHAGPQAERAPDGRTRREGVTAQLGGLEQPLVEPVKPVLVPPQVVRGEQEADDTQAWLGDEL